VIIGGGAAGTLAAIHLVEARVAGHIRLVERSGSLGSGVAYATGDPLHLLNVPAGRMSAYSGDSDHFVRWLQQRSDVDSNPEAYVPRRYFGEYLVETLEAACARSAGSPRFEAIRAAAVAVRAAGGGLEVELADGSRLVARQVVLAVGPRPRSAAWPGAERLAGSCRYVHDPWAPGALGMVGRGDRVVLAGTGLTMVDVALTLAARGAELQAISRHGLVPRAHDPRVPLQPAAAWREAPVGLRLVDLLRQARRRAAQAGDWRGVVDEYRTQANEIWAGLPLSEQQRFVRHVRRHWDVHRHRMAPQTAAQLGVLLAEQRLRVRAASFRSAGLSAAGIDLSVQLRGAGELVRVRADYLVNCTGFAEAIDHDPQPLIASLFVSGLARPDDHRIGLAVNPLGGLLDSRGEAGPILALGALRRATVWESTAIAELRVQAETLAATVAEASSYRQAR
jgi:uncharacterized NAD(P)/FAD-binding protein YdhS